MKIGELTLSQEVQRLNPQLKDSGISADVKTTPPSKYHNCRTEFKGMLFDSGREAAGISKLIIADEAHQIFGLRLQVIFPLYGPYGTDSYRADAVYSSLDNGKLTLHVVDFKGCRTREFKRKSKAFKEIYGQNIEEL